MNPEVLIQQLIDSGVDPADAESIAALMISYLESGMSEEEALTQARERHDEMKEGNTARRALSQTVAWTPQEKAASDILDDRGKGLGDIVKMNEDAEAAKEKTLQDLRDKGVEESEVDLMQAALEGRIIPPSWASIAQSMGLDPTDLDALEALAELLGVDIETVQTESDDRFSDTGEPALEEALTPESHNALFEAWDALSQVQQEFAAREMVGVASDLTYTFDVGGTPKTYRAATIDSLEKLTGYSNSQQFGTLMNAADINGMDMAYLALGLERLGFWGNQRNQRTQRAEEDRLRSKNEETADPLLGAFDRVVAGLFGGTPEEKQARREQRREGRKKGRSVKDVYEGSRTMFATARQLRELHDKYETWVLTFIALENPQLAEKLLNGETVLTAQDFEFLGDFQNDFNAENLRALDVGISALDAEQLNYLDRLATEQAGGGGGSGGVTVTLPDPDSIRAGVVSMYRQIMRREPSESEIQKWIGQINSDYTGQIKMPGLDEEYNPFSPAARQRMKARSTTVNTEIGVNPGDSIMAALRNSNEYKQLYKHKPGAIGEDEYANQFNTSPIVGQQRDYEAERSGMMTGQVNTSIGAAFGRGVMQTGEANSVIQERLARLMGVFNMNT